ncbi:dienelactone hydrolase family protein [Synechococcus sp. 8F6]|uniref:dienelactone hydrolase family protein n=1 Tax=Synechococcus sp. 8F6 TaxID=2025606 RepID=UPI000B9929AA|nr:dienelactone hydrolase family protein [Synechococcus sp. 8F6]
MNQSPVPVQAGWQLLSPQLRGWWAWPADRVPRAAVLVLPEVFGVNGWVRSVAERLAGHGYAALALPIFSRTAPDLDVGYDAAGLEEGRRHRDQLTAAEFLDDARTAIAWLQVQPGLEQRPVGCVGFCFGGHLALLAASLPEVAATCDFYGARVSTDRPGGGPPTLAVMPQISGKLLCFCGDHDPLMPPEELAAIEAALAANGQPPLIVAAGAGHGFMCEARADSHPAAAAEGWSQMLALFEERL